MSAASQPTSLPAVPETPSASADFLPLKGTDHIEFYVGNARQAAYFYRAAFGMSLVAYAGPETGQRDRATYVVQQGKIRFALTTPLRSGNAVAEHVHRHGDAVRVIALWVDDADFSIERSWPDGHADGPGAGRGGSARGDRAWANRPGGLCRRGPGPGNHAG